MCQSSLLGHIGIPHTHQDLEIRDTCPNQVCSLSHKIYSRLSLITRKHEHSFYIAEDPGWLVGWKQKHSGDIFARCPLVIVGVLENP